MTKAVHNYTDPFRRDRPGVKCAKCDKPAAHVVVTLGGLTTHRVCHDHYYLEEVDPDVHSLPSTEGGDDVQARPCGDSADA